MWSTKLLSAIALVSTYLATGSLGHPTVDSLDTHTHERTPNELELGFEPREPNAVVQSASVDPHDDSSVDFPILGKRTPESALWGVVLRSDCSGDLHDKIVFSTRVRWDSKQSQIHFDKVSNIDRLEETDTEGVPSSLYYKAEAKIYHQACRPKGSNGKCSYLYVATLLATVEPSHYNPPRINLYAYNSDEKNAAKMAVLFETCAFFKAGEKEFCPPIDGRLCKVYSPTETFHIG